MTATTEATLLAADQDRPDPGGILSSGLSRKPFILNFLTEGKQTVLQPLIIIAVLFFSASKMMTDKLPSPRRHQEQLSFSVRHILEVPKLSSVRELTDISVISS